MAKINWVADESNGIKFKFAIDKENKAYRLKIISRIPRRYYHSCFNEIGLMIEQKHWKELSR